MIAGWLGNPGLAAIQEIERLDNRVTHGTFGVGIYRITVIPRGIDFSFELGQIHFYLLLVRH